MTVNEAIAKAVSVGAEGMSRALLADWVAEIENTVICEIASTHEGMEYESSVITPESDGERVLFAPEPYSQLYVYYIIMKCDEYLGDTQRYINSAGAFSSAYNTFADWYNRTYMPLQTGKLKL